jgi:hypothetical protein
MTERRFRDWSRVTTPAGRTGVVVWDPTSHEYAVLWDDNGWDSYDPDTTEFEEA